jgi:hypothetical protein
VSKSNNTDAPALCPRDGRPLIAVRDDERFFECFCGFRWDAHLSREAEPGEVEGDATIEAAERWLADDDLLGRLVEAITAPGTPDELVGEEDTAAQLLLCLLRGLSVEVRGNSGAGKNALANHVLSIFPPSWVLRVNGLSDKAIRYLDEDIRILYITERRGLQSGKRDEESTAEYDVKVGISEGEISVTTVERDEETGHNKSVTLRHKVGSFVFTTTELTSPPELENRLVVLNVDDSPAQNERVRDFQLTQARTPSWEKRDAEKLRAVARKALELIASEAPGEVVLPYGESLKPLFRVEDSAVRRHTLKIRALVEASARLHYRQRQIIEGPGGKRAVVASPLDFGIILYVSLKSFTAMLGALPEKANQVLGLAHALEGAHLPITTSNLLLRALDSQVYLSRRTIQKGVGYLSERGILAPTGERVGRSPIYALQGGGRPFAIQPDALIRATWAEAAPYTSTGRAGAMSTGLDLNAAERPAGSEDAGHPQAPILGSDGIAHARTGGTEAPLGEPQPPGPQGEGGP